MATITLNWSLGAGALTNIDSICIYMGATDGGETCATLRGYAEAGSGGTLVAEFTDMANVPVTYDHTDAGLAAGDYTFGIYAKNTAGVSPCLTNPVDDSITVVTVV